MADATVKPITGETLVASLSGRRLDATRLKGENLVEPGVCAMIKLNCPAVRSFSLDADAGRASAQRDRAIVQAKPTLGEHHDCRSLPGKIFASRSYPQPTEHAKKFQWSLIPGS